MHAVGLTLHRSGLVDYRSNITDVDHFIDELGLAPFIEKIAKHTTGMLNVAGNDRSAEPLRHLGDVGATFEGSRSAPERYGEQAGPARVGPRVDRAQAPAKAPEQLR